MACPRSRGLSKDDVSSFIYQTEIECVRWAVDELFRIVSQISTQIKVSSQQYSRDTYQVMSFSKKLLILLTGEEKHASNG
mmetsp:Transcript_28886/g.54290  ORF Transcript_28886/g.54290 Transcript_28886/m.54290 type:complete len:80 (+) Transcript_28886:325-564(+)